jgi:hypothetical protein
VYFGSIGAVTTLNYLSKAAAGTMPQILLWNFQETPKRMVETMMKIRDRTDEE